MALLLSILCEQQKPWVPDICSRTLLLIRFVVFYDEYTIGIDIDLHRVWLFPYQRQQQQQHTHTIKKSAYCQSALEWKLIQRWELLKLRSLGKFSIL